jgi:hypothetical protein
MNPGGIYGGQPSQQEMGDFAQSQAGGASARRAAENRGTIVFGANAAPVAPANVAAPTSFNIAVIALTPFVSGRFMFNFNFSFTDSAADTTTTTVGLISPYTSVSGGTLLNHIYWESSPITISGAVILANMAEDVRTFGAGNLGQTVQLSGISFTAPLAVPCLLVLQVTATHNLSAMLLTASAQELG